MKNCLKPTKQRHRGYLLNEVLIGFALVSLVVLLFGRQALTIFSGWQRMRLDGELLDGGRYVIDKVERHLALEATAIQIKDDQSIVCATEYPERTFRIYFDDYRDGLYLRSRTRTGAGVNSLIIRDCPVTAWQVEKIREREILVRFTLTKQGRSMDFVRLIYCVNGVVENGS